MANYNELMPILTPCPKFELLPLQITEIYCSRNVPLDIELECTCNITGILSLNLIHYAKIISNMEGFFEYKTTGSALSYHIVFAGTSLPAVFKIQGL